MAQGTGKQGKTLEELQAIDQQHHLHPFTSPSSLRQAPPFLIDSAEGCYVTGQGIKLLDMMAGLGCVNIGYGREEMAETVSEAMRSLSYYHSFSAVSNPTAAALAGAVIDLAPEGMNKVFFANSGSEANESALKLIRSYWRKKGQENKRIILTRDYAYHGSTLATTALNGNMAMLEPYGLENDADIVRAAAPYWYRNGGNATPAEHASYAARSVEEKILKVGPDNVAAMFIEPIQATMGAIIPPQEYLPEVERICRKYDVLVVADEVVTGLGRTGHWFAQETFGFKADIMTLAKGLSSGYVPISAVVLHDDIVAVIEGGEDIFQHGFTTSAHPVMAAVALKNIDILKNDKLIDRIRDDIGPYFSEKLSTLENHPLVGEVRSCGLIAGIELAQDKATRAQYPIDVGICEHVSQACLVQGVIIRPTGNSLVLCPPFTIKRVEIDHAISVIEQALTHIHQAIMNG